MRSIRKTALIFLLVSVLLAAAIRITSVNAAAEKPIIDTYSQNEWVPLGGSYFRSYQENTNGYSVMITGHEIIDRKDYLEKYGLDPSSVNEENSFRYIMEVSLTIRNENNEEGKIMKCFMCDGDLEEKKVNYVVDLEETIIIIKGVPAKVCPQCGEQYFDDKTSENIERIVNQLKQLATEVTIVNYTEKVA